MFPLHRGLGRLRSRLEFLYASSPTAFRTNTETSDKGFARVSYRSTRLNRLSPEVMYTVSVSVCIRNNPCPGPTLVRPYRILSQMGGQMGRRGVDPECDRSRVRYEFLHRFVDVCRSDGRQIGSAMVHS